MKTQMAASLALTMSAQKTITLSDRSRQILTDALGDYVLELQDKQDNPGSSQGVATDGVDESLLSDALDLLFAVDPHV